MVCETGGARGIVLCLAVHFSGIGDGGSNEERGVAVQAQSTRPKVRGEGLFGRKSLPGMRNLAASIW